MLVTLEAEVRDRKGGTKEWVAVGSQNKEDPNDC